MYSNLALITHSEQEFVIDFLFLSPQQPRAKVRSRVITSPKHAKRIHPGARREHPSGTKRDTERHPHAGDRLPDEPLN